jgi:hypothetical protein
MYLLEPSVQVELGVLTEQCSARQDTTVLVILQTRRNAQRLWDLIAQLGPLILLGFHALLIQHWVPIAVWVAQLTGFCVHCR